MDDIWIIWVIWLIMCCIMAALYRRLWIFLGLAAIGLFIAWKQVWCWFIVPGSICLILVIPFLLHDYKLSKTQHLRSEIEYKERTLRIAFDLRQELERLEQMSTLQWVMGHFRKRK